MVTKKLIVRYESGLSADELPRIGQYGQALDDFGAYRNTLKKALKKLPKGISNWSGVDELQLYEEPLNVLRPINDSDLSPEALEEQFKKKLEENLTPVNGFKNYRGSLGGAVIIGAAIPYIGIQAAVAGSVVLSYTTIGAGVISLGTMAFSSARAVVPIEERSGIDVPLVNLNGPDSVDEQLIEDIKFFRENLSLLEQPEDYSIAGGARLYSLLMSSFVNYYAPQTLPHDSVWPFYLSGVAVVAVASHVCANIGLSKSLVDKYIDNIISPSVSSIDELLEATADKNPQLAANDLPHKTFAHLRIPYGFSKISASRVNKANCELKAALNV